MKKVFLSVGHGGTDSGAVANGLKEKDVNLVIGLQCAEELMRHGVEVCLSRTKDEEDKTKIAECNKFDPDLTGDIHNNAGRGDGCEIYHYSGGGPSKSLAENIAGEVKAIGQNLRLGTSGKYDGLKVKLNSAGNDYYAYIRETKAPAVIIECAFLDNDKDVQIIDTEAEQKAFGTAIAKGFLKELGIEYKEKPAPVKTDKLYRVQVGAYSVKANAEAMQKKLKSDGYDAIIV